MFIVYIRAPVLVEEKLLIEPFSVYYFIFMPWVAAEFVMDIRLLLIISA
jgi:hypothetical protein